MSLESRDNAASPLGFVGSARLEPLREKLRAHGQRESIVLPAATLASQAELVDALRLVEEWGPFVEAMYLMMAADRRMLNVEREVLRGALAVLSNDAVRTRHMEAMLDAASRKAARDGDGKRLERVMEKLRQDPARAEMAVVVAAAIAGADHRITPEEHALLDKLIAGLEIDPDRAQKILDDLEASVRT